MTLLAWIAFACVVFMLIIAVVQSFWPDKEDSSLGQICVFYAGMGASLVILGQYLGIW